MLPSAKPPLKPGILTSAIERPLTRENQTLNCVVLSTSDRQLTAQKQTFSTFEKPRRSGVFEVSTIKKSNPGAISQIEQHKVLRAI
jgi:hypothetical protein